ncbi:MAG: dephospho-CoA kinase [Christensenellales bacterium]
MKIAIIGNIGSGKSTVARYIASKGKVVLDCDVIAKEVMSERAIKMKIADALGVSERVVEDKEALSDAIFKDDDKRNALNAIVHGAVKERIEKYACDYDTIFVEVSVYAGSVLEGFFDKVIGVTCDESIRIERVMARSGYSLEKTKSIIAAQPSDETIRRLSDWIIVNQTSEEEVYGKIDELLECIELK